MSAYFPPGFYALLILLGCPSKKRMTEKENVEILKKCPSFERCNKNKCPLDYFLEERYKGQKCKWMCEAAVKKIAGREITFGGQTMPDDLLKLVPENNLKWLNAVSRQKRGI